MALECKNWTVNTYEVAEWVDLVAEPATLATVLLSNVSPTEKIRSKVRLCDLSGNHIVTLIPEKLLDVGEAYAIDINSLNITESQKLQVQADTVGMEFMASGVILSAEP